VFRALFSRLRGRPATSGTATVAPTHARRLERADDRLSGELTLVARLLDGDCILCVAGDVIPCAGIVLDGCALVRDGTLASAAADAAPWVLGYGASVRPGMAVVSNFLIIGVGDHLRRDETRLLSALLVDR
jgi:high-affinity K+ transport system ATPase subunit B